MRCLEGGIFRGGPHGKFIHIDLADQDGTGGLELFNDRSIVWRDKIFQNPGGTGGPDTLSADEVLDGQGNACQRGAPAFRKGLVRDGGLNHCQFIIDRDKCADPVFDGMNPFQDSLRQFL